MFYETINMLEAVNLFRHLMQPHSQMRVLQLVGTAKMGKSHLITKIFPALARDEYQADWAILDLRNRMQTVPDTLHIACSQLGTKHFANYYSAHQEWTNRPKVEVRNLFARFSRIDISAKESREDAHYRDRHLTTQFVGDLSKHSDTIMLLLFDSIDSAAESIQTWLTDMLLVQVSRLDHIRVVIAGRSLPETNGSYSSLCRNYQLQPVIEMEAYFTYCQNLKATLVEQSIRDLVHACDYIPGMFVEFVLPKFIQQRRSNG
jgi:hypothetical protein